ncbi:MAG: hypothetical protein M3Y04_09355 [Actinomycetota bacterium]|nr:hypothetical protein [Actinomycetota bacterium]
MAAVSVFVDEAVQGRLPMVCVRTGQPTDMLVRTTRAVGGGMNGAAWLLLLLGPPGWGILFLLAMLGSGREQLTIRIPRSRADFDSERQLRGLLWGAVGAAAVAFLCALVFAARGMPLLWLALGGFSMVAAVVLGGMIFRNDIGVSLDASRRWVTLTGVHPDFVRAVELQKAEAHRS